jgi:hypothetical protein
MTALLTKLVVKEYAEHNHNDNDVAVANKRSPGNIRKRIPSNVTWNERAATRTRASTLKEKHKRLMLSNILPAPASLLAAQGRVREEPVWSLLQLYRHISVGATSGY